MSVSGYLGTDALEGTATSPPETTWTIRRVPVLAARAIERHQRSVNALEAIGTTGGCLLAADGDGTSFASVRPSEAHIPASTLKVLTGVAALQALGEDGHLRTEILSPSPKATGAVPDLWVRGGGDPSWATEDFIAWEKTQPFGKGGTRTAITTLADEIAATGITSVGQLHGDASKFSGPAFLPDWKESYRSDGEVGAISALTINRGLENYRTSRSVANDPAAAFAESLAEALESRGITVQSHDSSSAPASASVLLSRSSPPMRDLVASMLRTSDNLAAEMFIRAIGATNGTANTLDGIVTTHTALAELNISTTDLRQVDGSGLARANQVTCQTVFDALTALAEHFQATDSLARAGSTGTLAGVGEALSGVLFAKTGSLSGVSGLAGVLYPTEVPREALPASTTADPETVRFALLLQGSFGESEGARLRLQVAQALEGSTNDVGYPTVLPAP